LKIGTEKVLIYGRDGCPYCVKVKQLFDSKNVKYEYRNISVDAHFEEQVFMNYITVPMVFINGNFIGGNSDTQALNDSGDLDPLLNA
jgi:glutaredoxin 3